jgi:cbb3-type cytochrome oxidase subunit 3
MDLNDIRSGVTLAGLLLFIALVAWTWWPSRRAAHQSAAAAPFEGEIDPVDAEGAGQ